MAITRSGYFFTASAQTQADRLKDLIDRVGKIEGNDEVRSPILSAGDVASWFDPNRSVNDNLPYVEKEINKFVKTLAWELAGEVIQEATGAKLAVAGSSAAVKGGTEAVAAASKSLAAFLQWRKHKRLGKFVDDATSNVGQRLGTRQLPDGDLPWQKYQRHVTGRNYEEIWQLSQREMASDGRRAGFLVEAKWTGRNDAAWRTSPYNPASRYYNEAKILEQVRGYLELHSVNGGKGIRYAVSNDAARQHFESLFRIHFKAQVDSGLLKVFHVPGDGM